MSNTDDMLYEHCKSIALEIEKIADNGFYYRPDDDSEEEFYFDDNYNIDYIWRSDVGLIGVRIMVAFGGPNIWVNTLSGYVEGYWGGEAKYPLSISTCDKITEIYEDIAPEIIYNQYQNGVR